jgi:fructan beta-fructosidase
MNDPNGLVYLEGEYHLFFQYNPFGDRWGHMSWGHAVSRDLVRWQHLAPALLEEDGVMIFSGSAVVDRQNTSGLGSAGQPLLVALYTGHHAADPLQTQNLAYSTDRGRSWVKYGGNPVLDVGRKDFRDPRVFWHGPTGRWVMVVALPDERRVSFYASRNLSEWEYLSDFGPAGSTAGIWECPDLFEVPVEGTAGSRWVLIVSVGDHAPAGGSGCQYFVGDFDGVRFTAKPMGTGHGEPGTGGGTPPGTRSPAPAGTRKGEPLGTGQSALVGTGHHLQAGTGQTGGGQVPDGETEVTQSGEVAQWVDYGPDFYAAVSWSNAPQTDGRPPWIGWMNNWRYAEKIPTRPWRGAMSVPRELALRLVGGQPLLVQRPTPYLQQLRQSHQRMQREKVDSRLSIRPSGRPDLRTYELDAVVEPAANAAFEILFARGSGEATILRVDVPSGYLLLDRSRSGQVGFDSGFPASYRAPFRLRNGRLRMQALIDRSSVELFVNEGEQVITSLIFPNPSSSGLDLEVRRGRLESLQVDLWDLASVWAEPSPR